MAKLAAAEKNARERELRRKNRVARGPTQDADDDDDDDGMGGWKAVFIIFLGEAQRTSPSGPPPDPPLSRLAPPVLILDLTLRWSVETAHRTHRPTRPFPAGTRVRAQASSRPSPRRSTLMCCSGSC